jgi:hypothetical protein
MFFSLGSLFVASYSSQDYGGDILSRSQTGHRTEVTGLFNPDADTIESSVWVNEETLSLKLCYQANSFCIDSRNYFTSSVVAGICPANGYSPTEPLSATSQQWATEKTLANRSAPANLSATFPVIVTVCILLTHLRTFEIVTIVISGSKRLQISSLSSPSHMKRDFKTTSTSKRPHF